jgi:hypothetical protein
MKLQRSLMPADNIGKRCFFLFTFATLTFLYLRTLRSEGFLSLCLSMRPFTSSMGFGYFMAKFLFATTSRT